MIEGTFDFLDDALNRINRYRYPTNEQRGLVALNYLRRKADERAGREKTKPIRHDINLFEIRGDIMTKTQEEVLGVLMEAIFFPRQPNRIANIRKAGKALEQAMRPWWRRLLDRWRNRP